MALQHAFDAALAEAAGHENAVEVFELRFVRCGLGFEAFGFDPGHVQLQVVGQRAVDQRFFQRLVGVFVLDVLADDADRDFVLGVVARGRPCPPSRVRSRSLRVDVQVVAARVSSTPSLRRTPAALRRWTRRPWR